ncbi:hypothetical protein HH308_16370 [Gordonia sp. TBRC 11910]|uniref:Uncharacterized protein n=1 Tax=Gordonia asplenii TaxID=2725283 RepID=A0A848L595_9ACTN|nr:DUF6541 family protein [Gordonia asplenii]NMO02788.1 hypothetical protein [Gordonia asplenii]
MMLTAWVAIVTTVLLVVPGAVVARRMGVAWPVAVAVGPPVTFLIVSLATVFYGIVGFEWNLVTAAIALIVALVAALGYSRIVESRTGRRLLPAPDAGSAAPLDVRGCLGVAAGVAVGAVIIVTTAVRPLITPVTGGLNSISQVWDSLWHASSLRWIHESGVGSSLRMGELMNYDNHGFNFYPNTWHALGALVFPLTGANPVELYNTYSPAVLAITVPLGVASLAYWFARHRFSPSESAMMAAIGAALAGLFPSLPYVELALTSVPNAVGVSMAPIAAVFTISAVRDRRRIVPAAIVVAGVTATHPSGLVLTAVIVGLWWLTEALWRPINLLDAGRAWRARLTDIGALASTLVLALVLSAPVIYGTMKIADNNELSGFSSLDKTANLGLALRQALFNYTIPLTNIGPVWTLVAASVIGAGVLIWLRCWGALATWLVFVLLAANSVVLLGPLSGPLGELGGYFYNSSHRLTFVTAMFSAAAAATLIGVVALWVARRLAARPSAKTGAKPFARTAVPVVLALTLALIVGGAVYRYPVDSKSASKQRNGRLIDADDVAAFHWLADQPGARKSLILNNLDQGTGWIYPVTGLTPMFPFYRSNDFSQRQRDLYWAVSKIGVDAHVDGIVRDMNVRYVIDSPPSYWAFQNGVPDPDHGIQGDPFLALRAAGGAPGLTEVFRRGNVTIYRVNDDVLAGKK